MKFGLLTVSYAGLFYSGPALSIKEQIYKAKEIGFDGISIEAKRPVASPLDLTAKDRAGIKEIAAGEGMEICAVESLSNFCSRIMEERENNLAMMRMVLKLAQDLGVKLVKVFAAWPGLIDENDIAEYGPYQRGNHYKRLYTDGLLKWQRAVQGIREVADLAADMGITLALQNHVPVITPGYEDVLAMKNEIDKKNLKLCLDVPLFYERQEDDYVIEAVKACGNEIVLSHYGAWNFNMDKNGEPIQEPAPSFGGLINYKTFVRELVEIEYDGYLVSEYCVPALDHHQPAGLEHVDLANRIALKYIKDLIAQHQKSATHDLGLSMGR